MAAKKAPTPAPAPAAPAPTFEATPAEDTSTQDAEGKVVRRSQEPEGQLLAPGGNQPLGGSGEEDFRKRALTAGLLSGGQIG